MADEFQPKPVGTFNGRQGFAAVPQTGDYTARQVTNAVDQTVQYPNPAFVRSLAFAKLSGLPVTLAGYGITDAQPLDADLTAIAALSTTAFGRGFLVLADAAAALAYVGAGSGGVSWSKVATKTHSDLSAAATSNNIEAYSLPLKTVVHGAILNVTATFGGGLLAGYNISLGISGTLGKYVALTAATAGTLNGVTSAVPCLENFSGATSIRLAATSAGGNLSVATTGSVDIYLATSLLP